MKSQTLSAGIILNQCVEACDNSFHPGFGNSLRLEIEAIINLIYYNTAASKSVFKTPGMIAMGLTCDNNNWLHNIFISAYILMDYGFSKLQQRLNFGEKLYIKCMQSQVSILHSKMLLRLEPFGGSPYPLPAFPRQLWFISDF